MCLVEGGAVALRGARFATSTTCLSGVAVAAVAVVAADVLVAGVVEVQRLHCTLTALGVAGTEGAVGRAVVGVFGATTGLATVRRNAGEGAVGVATARCTVGEAVRAVVEEAVEWTLEAVVGTTVMVGVVLAVVGLAVLTVVVAAVRVAGVVEVPGVLLTVALCAVVLGKGLAVLGRVSVALPATPLDWSRPPATGCDAVVGGDVVDVVAAWLLLAGRVGVVAAAVRTTVLLVDVGRAAVVVAVGRSVGAVNLGGEDVGLKGCSSDAF